MSEELGFSHIWVGDSHLIWREAYVNMAAMALSTSKVKLGTGVLTSGVGQLDHARIAAVCAGLAALRRTGAQATARATAHPMCLMRKENAQPHGYMPSRV